MTIFTERELLFLRHFLIDVIPMKAKFYRNRTSLSVTLLIHRYFWTLHRNMCLNDIKVCEIRNLLSNSNKYFKLVAVFTASPSLVQNLHRFTITLRNHVIA